MFKFLPSTIILLFVVIVFSACNKEIAESASNESVRDEKAPQEKVDNKKETAVKELKVQQEKAQFKGGYKIYYSSGQQKHNAGDFSGAISDFTKAIEEKPDSGDAYGFRGLSKFKSGDETGACADWRKAEELGYQQATQMIQNYCN